MINRRKIVRLFEFYIVRCFSSPETFIKYYISKNGGSIKLNDGTWVVNQSDEFHSYCYNEGYSVWKKSKA